MTFYQQHLPEGFSLPDSLVSKAQEVVSTVEKAYQAGDFPFLKVSELTKDIQTITPLCERFSKTFKDVILLGTGGSSLGGKTLCDLVQSPFSPSKESDAKRPKVHFVDNIDPHTLEAMLATFDFKTTGFVVISKSGSTTETLCQFLVVLDQARKTLAQEMLRDHFVIVSEPKSSPLVDLATRFDLPLFDHSSKIGGRFSVLSLVGLIPALIAGVPVVDIHRGAGTVLKEFQEKGVDSLPAQGAAFMHTAETRSYGSHVMMPYCDRLVSFSAWHCQLWAESLGKEGKGTTPIQALGTVDQHSQLQLFLEGPRDKVFTFLMLEQKGLGPEISGDLASDPSLSYLAGHRVGDLMAAEQEATFTSLTNHLCPVRRFTLKALDGETLGALLMHFMLETVLTAAFMGVNAFDQPAVEESKVLTREFLKQARAS